MTIYSSEQTQSFIQKAQNYWTSERLAKLTSSQRFQILPTNAPLLLRALGLLNQDASMSADSMRKFIQVNHLLAQFKPHLEDLNDRIGQIRILDAGCGRSFLTFTLAWAYKELWHKEAILYGVDSNAKLIVKNEQTAKNMGVDHLLKFFTSSIQDIKWNDLLESTNIPPQDDPKKTRAHAVLALHACDTATDDAIALGIQQKSDFIAVAPCCQAELARSWKESANSIKNHPLRSAFSNPHLRRELAAHFTDLTRVLILRGHGYEVTTTEFTMSHATPKNTLILASRRGNYHHESQNEYEELRKYLGGFEISLASKAPFK